MYRELYYLELDFDPKIEQARPLDSHHNHNFRVQRQIRVYYAMMVKIETEKIYTT